MNSEQVSGLVRHLMTAFGGIAIAKGYTDSGTVELASGTVATLAAVAWSYWAKREKGAAPGQVQ